jgi:hypothetical protein
LARPLVTASFDAEVSDQEPDPLPIPLSPEDSRMVIVDRQMVSLSMINTAIYLWFREADMVSEHLLAASAANVLKGVGKTKGVTSHAFNKEMEELLGKKLRLAMNFFKHAENDPNLVLKFGPVVTEFFLIDAIQMYGKLYHSMTPLMHTFRAWFMVIRGQHVRAAEEVRVFLPEGVQIDEVVSLRRRQFMEKLLPLFITQYPL